MAASLVVMGTPMGRRDACPGTRMRPFDRREIQLARVHNDKETEMTDCIFCKIASGEIKSDRVYEDDEIVAFRDLNPQAPTHVLLIPRRHIATTNDLTPDDAALIGRLTLAAKEIAEQEGIAGRGYRTVLNCNAEAGQSVFHIHVHLLGGRPMRWPPG